VPIVEILAFDVDLEEYDAAKYKAKRAPGCKLTCVVAGHKLYNAFTVQTSVPRGTLIRIWLY
jgi:hypothetical protein